MGNVFVLGFSRLPGLCLYTRLLSDSPLPLPFLFSPSRSYSNRHSPSWSTGVPTPGWGGQIILLCGSNCVQWQIITMVLLTNFLDAFPKSQVYLPVFTQDTMSQGDTALSPSQSLLTCGWGPQTRTVCGTGSQPLAGVERWLLVTHHGFPQRTRQTKNSKGLSVSF